MSYQSGYLKISRGEEVRQRICQCHLAYLNQEETPSKLEQRRNLEGLIAEYLSLVPHNQKFNSLQVRDVLHRSIVENPSFSVYKGAAAFQALEKYATNLLSHPWRKEYKIVKLYSGYFKHTVEVQLVDAESIFILLGYEKHDDILFLDGPVDPDHVTGVALDCLIAYVECQVMIQICEKITNYKCTWEEIHQVREDYVCGIDEAVRILQQFKRSELEEEKQISFEKQQEKEILEEDDDISQNIPCTGVLVDLSNTWPNSSRSGNTQSLPPNQFDNSPYTIKQSNPRLAVSHSRSPSWSEGVSSQLDRQQQIRRRVAKSEGIDDMWTGPSASNWSDHNRLDDIASDGMDDPWDFFTSIPRPFFQENYNSYADFDRNGLRMNYSQYPHMKNMYNSSYVTNFNSHFHPHSNYPFMPHPDIFMNTMRQCRCHTCCEQPAMFSHRDMLGGIEAREKYCRMDRSEMPPYVAGAFHKLSLDSYPQLPKPWHPSTEGMQKLEMQKNSDVVDSDSNAIPVSVNSHRTHQTNKRSSFYDNVSHDPELLSTNVACKKDDNITNVLIPHTKSTSSKNSTEKNTSSKNHIPVAKVTSVVELPYNDLQNNNTTSTSKPIPRKDCDVNKWSCSFCTYINSSAKKVCEMCGRSRFIGAESTPLISGGRECPQCTLVNEKDAKDCTACGTSLKDSPTYI